MARMRAHNIVAPPMAPGACPATAVAPTICKLSPTAADPVSGVLRAGPWNR